MVLDDLNLRVRLDYNIWNRVLKKFEVRQSNFNKENYFPSICAEL